MRSVLCGKDRSSVCRRLVVGAAFFAGTFVNCSAVIWAASNGPTDARLELRNEISAGGLIFSANSHLVIDQQDVTITAESVQVIYAIRNTDASDQTITIAFPLADIDSNVPVETQAEFATSNPSNFMDFVIAVDGRRATVAVEQRAIAVGLDVTKALSDAGLPLFPLAGELSQRLVELEPVVRNDLVERGILKLDDDTVLPMWAVKTTAHWRQPFPAGQTLAFTLNYKPIVGRNPFSSGALQPLKKGACIDDVTEHAISRLASQGSALTMISMGYTAHPGGEALGPIGRFRLTIEKSEVRSVVATCRQGLTRTGPTTSDWTAANYAADEEFRFLFVR
jgi:Domain of unknown function (DUF4424)